MSLAGAVSLCVLSLLPVEVCCGFVCDGGHFCAGANECCEDGCCYPYPHQRPSPPPPPPHGALDIFIYNHWYFWCMVCAASLLACGAWWAWRRRARLCGACCASLARRSRASDRDSAGSCYLPPHYSRCSSFHRAPPPYNEVTSKPDLYPLVITYGDNGDKGGAGSNYLTVHYFRNYIIRPPGSLSATSTAESLNSSFLCNATNEANSVVPPPYSCAGSFDEWRGGGGGGRGSPRPALLRSLSSLTCDPPRAPRPAPPAAPLRIDDAPAACRHDLPGLVRLDMSPEAIGSRNFRDTPSRETRYTIDDIDFDVLDYIPGYEARLIVKNPQGPRLGLSPPPEPSSSPTAESPEADPWRHVYVSMLTSSGACESPPRPTSPTMDPACRQKTKKSVRGKKTSMYMPLAPAGCKWPRASPAAEASGRTFAQFTQRAFSISAPSTPCGSGLVPTLMTLTQKMSGSVLSSKSSRLNREESNPLISECEEQDADRTDGQF